MNTRELERLKHDGKDREIGFGNGLYIRVRASSKTWVFRTKIGGKMRVKTLGKFPHVSINDAQRMALEQKSSLTAAVTTGIFIEEYYKDCILGSHNRNKKPHKRPEQALRYLNQLKDEFGSQILDNVTKKDLAAYIRKYSTEHGPRTAEVMRVHLNGIFSDALERGVVAVNPMAGVTSKASGYKQVNRTRVLSDDEIRDIWSWRNNSQGWQKTEENVKVIKFLLLTGLRISEAQQGYVDGDKFRVDDSKNGKSHWVYLTRLAREQLPLPKCTPTNIQAWLRRKLESEGYKEKSDRYVLHDARRSYATRLNNDGVAPHIVEKCLNHTLEGVARVYNQAEHEDGRIEAALAMERLINEIID